MQPESEKKPSSRRFGMTFFAWLLVTAVVGFSIYVYFHSPFESRVTFCLFHSLTGLDCPGCGMTRAAYLLMHGHPVAALRQNPFILVVLMAGYMGIAELSPYLFGRQFKQLVLPTWMLIALGALLVIFTIARNVVKFL